MNLTKIHWGINTLLAVMTFLGIQGCSLLTVRPPAPALDDDCVKSIVSAFAEQEKAAKTLFYTGSLTLKGRDSENSAQILMIVDTQGDMSERDEDVFTRGRMKMEITHPWGKSLLHILLEDQQLNIMDFNEKRFYKGRLRSRYLSSYLPVPLNPAILWSLARAFPALLNHQETASKKGDQIDLLDAHGATVQAFELYLSEPLPHRVIFVREKAEMVFSGFEDDFGIIYAKELSLVSPGHHMSLAILIDQIKFNSPIPEAVFKMVPPRDFETIHLKDDHREP